MRITNKASKLTTKTLIVETVKIKIVYGAAPCKFGRKPVMFLHDMCELHGVI
jgi:hypothetical protein